MGIRGIQMENSDEFRDVPYQKWLELVMSRNYIGHRDDKPGYLYIGLGDDVCYTTYSLVDIRRMPKPNIRSAIRWRIRKINPLNAFDKKIIRFILLDRYGAVNPRTDLMGIRETLHADRQFNEEII